MRVDEMTFMGTSLERALGSGGTMGVLMRTQAVEDRREARAACMDMAKC